MQGSGLTWSHRGEKMSDSNDVALLEAARRDSDPVLREFLRLLALCHTVMVEERGGGSAALSALCGVQLPCRAQGGCGGFSTTWQSSAVVRRRCPESLGMLWGSLSISLWPRRGHFGVVLKPHSWSRSTGRIIHPCLDTFTTQGAEEKRQEGLRFLSLVAWTSGSP